MNQLPEGLFSQLRAPWAFTCPAELARLEWGLLEITYLVAVDTHGQPAAMLPAYLTRGSCPPGCDPHEVFGVDTDGAPVMLLGSSTGYVNHVAVRDSGTGAIDAVEALLAAGIDLAHQVDAAATVAPHLDRDQLALVRATGRVAALAEPELRAVLELPGATFADYLAAIPHRRRADLRAERERFLRTSPLVRELPLAEVVREAAPLLAAVEQGYDHDVDTKLARWYLDGLATMPGEHMAALVLERDGRIVAFTALWERDTEYLVRAWGCDPEVVGRDGTYFNMTVYEPVVRAAARGIRRLDLGAKTSGAKARRGATLVPVATVLLDTARHPR